MICRELEIKEGGGTARLSCCMHEAYPKLPDSGRRPCILICPGGAYARTSDREADNVAAKCLAFGYQTAVLRYSTAPAVFPTALCQLGRAVALLREHEEEWHIHPDRIAVMGFSAGGHLTASLGNFWNRPFLSELLDLPANILRPNAQILCYPVITGGAWGHRESFQNLLGPAPEGEDPERWFLSRCEELSMEGQVGPDTPPTFLWHCTPDETVPAMNILLMAEALFAAKVPVELHLYGTGGHALGTADRLSRSIDGRGVAPECAGWMELCHTWLEGIWARTELRERPE